MFAPKIGTTDQKRKQINQKEKQKEKTSLEGVWGKVAFYKIINFALPYPNN
ncbi:MAG: hypothetical protein ACK42G_04450 [Candidatus Kapaibacteriota bacterium]